ncbi:MAG TPA: hypothetical protein VFO65_06400 [Acidimicrobiales bacterium]|nr:hypothetical protein [Acidimicrobiales bacterium]
MVLEDVALDAAGDADGRLLAATSARQVAEHLGVSPGSAAKALARLRSLGLVTHDRQPGPAGRFGLSLYRLLPPPGIEVVGRSGAISTLPGTGAPRVESPGTASPRAAERHVAAEARAGTKAADAATRPKRSVRRPGAVQDHQQLDLLAPASTIDQPTSQPHRTSTTTLPTLPANTTAPSSTPSSSPQTPTTTDTCQLFEQAAAPARAERC